MIAAEARRAELALHPNSMDLYFQGMAWLNKGEWSTEHLAKNRDRLLDGDIAAKFMTSVLNLPRVRNLLSSDHFSVDGTLIEAWASMKSFVPKDEGGKPPADRGSDCNHTPIEWAEKGVRKEDQVRPWLRRIANKNACGVYF